MFDDYGDRDNLKGTQTLTLEDTRTRRSPYFVWFAPLFVAVVVAGCPSEKVTEEPRPDPVASTATKGIITASSSSYIESGDGDPFEQFGIVGMFPRYQESGEYLLDGFLEDRVPELELALDTCSPPTPVFKSRPKRRLFDKTTIKLIDVGDISVDYLGTKRTLPTRTFPDLFKVIDGVIYSTDDTANVHFVSGETYTVHATGADEVSSFDVVLDAPDDLGEVKLNGIYPGENMPIISRNEDVVLSWEGEGYGDEVYVKVNWTGLGLSWYVSCRLKDDGHFVIPAEKTVGMYDPLSNNEHEFTISRVRQTAFRSKGLTSGEFRFVVSTNFLVKFDATQ